MNREPLEPNVQVTASPPVAKQLKDPTASVPNAASDVITTIAGLAVGGMPILVVPDEVAPLWAKIVYFIGAGIWGFYTNRRA